MPQVRAPWIKHMPGTMPNSRQTERSHGRASGAVPLQQRGNACIYALFTRDCSPHACTFFKIADIEEQTPCTSFRTF